MNEELKSAESSTLPATEAAQKPTDVAVVIEVDPKPTGIISPTLTSPSTALPIAAPVTTPTLSEPAPEPESDAAKEGAVKEQQIVDRSEVPRLKSTSPLNGMESDNEVSNPRPTSVVAGEEEANSMEEEQKEILLAVQQRRSLKYLTDEEADEELFSAHKGLYALSHHPETAKKIKSETSLISTTGELDRVDYDVIQPELALPSHERFRISTPKVGLEEEESFTLELKLEELKRVESPEPVASTVDVPKLGNTTEITRDKDDNLRRLGRRIDPKKIHDRKKVKDDEDDDGVYSEDYIGSSSSAESDEEGEDALSENEQSGREKTPLVTEGSTTGGEMSEHTDGEDPKRLSNRVSTSTKHTSHHHHHHHHDQDHPMYIVSLKRDGEPDLEKGSVSWRVKVQNSLADFFELLGIRLARIFTANVLDEMTYRWIGLLVVTILIILVITAAVVGSLLAVNASGSKGATTGSIFTGGGATGSEEES